MVQEQDYRDKKILVENLVNEAARLIETEGPQAIGIIEDKNGKFNTKDTYVFVTSGETGADLVNPAFPAVEGLPPENYADPDTKAAQMAIVDAVKNKDTAWVEYLWPKPGETRPCKKISYLKKMVIGAKVRIVGAGFYPD
jgi:signal transduction histidine kinase